MPYDVFISHASQDRTVATALCATLETQRIRCWMAPRDILPGTDYAEAIINGIGDCRLFIVVFSSEANGSAQVRREVDRAVSKEKVILPFRIEAITPSKAMEYCLGNTHWLDAITPPLESHFSRLADTVILLLGRPPADAGRKALVTPLLNLPAGDGGYEYRSEHGLFGLSLVHIAIGLPLVDGRRSGARGFIAIGDSPRGVIAIGPFPVGIVALGGFSIGLVSIGFVSFGAFSAGAMALGLVAGWGLVCVAPVAMGAVTVGFYAASCYPFATIAKHSYPSLDPEAVRFFQSWYKLWFNAMMTGLCLLSYLLPKISNLWVRSVLAARAHRSP